ncbi:hypothetical protein M5K25_019205 [Dendrobium thyrsiflorum]|uniref:Uncharacterized protein n=1 Tax=Dendrobium thyrsiflorum TaxID=117978 RepID=A0ABD0UEF3_DENTH
MQRKDPVKWVLGRACRSCGWMRSRGQESAGEFDVGFVSEISSSSSVSLPKWSTTLFDLDNEALASKFLSFSTGIFCQQILEYEVQVSCSNVHHVELILVFLELLWQLMRKLRDHAFLPKMERETNPQRSRQKSVGSENSIRDYAPASPYQSLVYHHKLKTGVGGNEDEPDQDPMVPSSRAVVFPGLLSQRSPGFLRKIRQPSGVPSPAPGDIYNRGRRNRDERGGDGHARRRAREQGCSAGVRSATSEAGSEVGIVVGVELAGPVEASAGVVGCRPAAGQRRRRRAHEAGGRDDQSRPVKFCSGQAGDVEDGLGSARLGHVGFGWSRTRRLGRR